jgi:hypothetical protein
MNTTEAHERQVRLGRNAGRRDAGTRKPSPDMSRKSVTFMRAYWDARKSAEDEA